MSERLSREARRAMLNRMATEGVDLLIVGGGITGAGVARDAALRGMRVGLVEKTDFAAGTSSRSSKIIHGGVRYLEYFQFLLVRESARERRVLRRIAPHLVHPLPFLFPVYRGESLLKIRAGLKLFDVLAGSPKGERSRALSPAETRALLPGLRDPLKGAVLYPEYITDDARFTLANLISAIEHGALAANHARVETLLVEEGRVVGARVVDEEEGREIEIRAPVTVNATGPWVQRLLTRSGLPVPQRIIPSRGSHILIRRERLPLKAASFLASSTGRRGLAMPRGEWVYVGTTDEEYTGDLDRTRAEAREVDDLVAMVQDCFPDAGITAGDVVATWAGLRPLIYEEGKATRDMSRHDEVWATPPGLVTVAGGKLTTYRAMARRILRATTVAGGPPLPGTETTDTVPLPWRPEGDLDAWRSRLEARMEGLGLGEETRDRLLFLYGTAAEQLLELNEEDPAWLEPLAPGIPALRGEVRRAVEREMALTLCDILDRRMALLLFSPVGGSSEDGGRAEAGVAEGAGVAEVAPAAAAIAAPLLGWSREREAMEIASYRDQAREHGPRGIG